MEAPDRVVVLGDGARYGHHMVIRCNQGSSPYGVARFLITGITVIRRNQA